MLQAMGLGLGLREDGIDQLNAIYKIIDTFSPKLKVKFMRAIIHV